MPITLRGLMSPGWDGFENRRSYWAYLFARLQPGVTLQDARTGLQVPYAAIIQGVEAPLQEGMSEKTMERFMAREVTVEDGWRGQSSIHEDSQVPLLLLLVVTGVVVLIACGNVANLLLARSAARSGEMAVRMSIGASRSKLVSQLLVESCLLATLGGLVGLVAAHWTLAGIGSLMPADALATVDLALNVKVVGFTAAVALATGVLFGLFPAWHSTHLDLASTLKGQSGQPSGARAAARFRASLVTAQIALSTTLLISAGLFTQSLLNVSRVDLGLQVDNMITLAVAPELNGYTPEQSRAFFVRAEEELAGGARSDQRHRLADADTLG